MKKLLTPLLAGSLLVGAIAGSQAATFAQFNQMFASNDFSFAPGSNTGSLVNNGGAVFLTFLPGSGFTLSNPALAGNEIGANLTFSATGNGSGLQVVPGGADVQNLNSVTFTFKTGAAQTINGVLVPAGTILLAGTATAPTPTGVAGTLTANGVPPAQPNGSAATIGVPAGTPVFTSQIIDFTGSSSRNFGFSFSNANITTGGAFPFTFFNPFSAAGTGTFSAQANPVPEPGSLALFAGLGVTGSLVALRRRSRRGVKRA
jgi:hypothetical protein